MLGIIAGVVRTVGMIVAAAVTVAKELTVTELAITVIKAVGNAIADIAKALGIIKPERDVAEIGDRALQAEEKGMTPENYASYEAWVREIEKDDWGYDPEKNKDMDPKEKINKGVEVASGVAIEKFPNLPMQEFLMLAGKNPEFFTTARWTEIGKLANKDPDTLAKIVNYVTGAVRDKASIDSAVDTLMDIEKTIHPGISDDKAYDKVAPFYSMK